MKTTPRKLIYDTYRELGVLRTGQGPSDDATDDAYRALNDMVEAWALESLMVLGSEGTAYPVQANLGSYTLGPGGTLGGVRPVRVDGAGFTYPQGSVGCTGETPLEVLTLDRYRTHRSGVYVDGSYPLANVALHPVPTVDGMLTLYTWMPLPTFTGLDKSYDLPPGYSRALRFNLALDVAPMARYMAKIPEVLYARIEQAAIESKAAIKSFHSTPPPILRGDEALGCGYGSYSICSDF